ncbi:Zncox4, partial [Lactifluus subvellereus]
DVFNFEPLDSSHIGTLADLIKVFFVDTERMVGCTGSPVDTHDVSCLSFYVSFLQKATEVSLTSGLTPSTSWSP